MNQNQQQPYYHPTIVSPPPAAPPPPPPPGSDVDENSVQSIPLNLSPSINAINDESPIMSYQKSRARNGTIPAITNYGLSPSMSNNNNNNPSRKMMSSSSLTPTPSSSGIRPPYQDDPRVPLVRSNGAADDNTTMIHNNSSSNGDGNEQQQQQQDYSNYSMSSMLRGDTTIRPNTGNTNQIHGEIIPGSLREKASTLRVMTVITTATAIVWEGFAFPIRILTLHVVVNPSEIVLGTYLGIFCLLILGIELNVPLRDNFGFLYNPFTRGIVLLLLSTMALGVLSSWWESLLGIAFIITGVGYIYTYIRHPEYRRWQDYNQNQQQPSAWQEVRMYWTRSSRSSSKDGSSGGGGRNATGYGSSSAIWADPDEGPQSLSSTWESIRQTSAEARSLLHNV